MLEDGVQGMATKKNAHHADGSRRLYSALEAARLLGVGRTYMFHLIATGQVESVEIGKLRKIPSEALDEYIDRLRAEQTSRR
jgi:excisionase family DNA binding protein